VLDNLGLSASEIREEFKLTGDLAQAVGNIIDQSMGDAGATVETTAEKMERMSANFKNFQTDIGQELLPLMDILLGVLEDVGEGAVFFQDKMFELFNYLGSQKAKNSLDDKEARKLVDTYLEMGITVEEAKFKLYELENGLASIPQSMAKLRSENGMTKEAYNELVEAQDSMLIESKALNTVIEILNSTITGTPDGTGDGGFNGAIKSTTEKAEDLWRTFFRVRTEQEILAIETTVLKELFDGFQFTIEETTQGIKGMSEAWQENYEQNKKNSELMSTEGLSWIEKQIIGLNALQDVFGSYSVLLGEVAQEQSGYAEFAKSLALFSIGIAQAEALAQAVRVVSTSAKTPLDYFVFLSSLLSSIAVTIGNARNTLEKFEAPKPAFATGVVDLKGAGTETSDSINARLSRGESVITAKGTRQDKGLFEAANKLQLEEYINKNYVLPALIKVEKDRSDMFDDYRLYRALRDGQKQDRELNKELIRQMGRRYKRYDWN